MSTTASVVRLHFAKRQIMLGTPLYILGVVALITVVIVLTLQRVDGLSGSADLVEGTRWNQGMFWGSSGFLVYLGVQSVATTFPFGLALGVTRRSYIAGTLLSHVLLSAYLTAVISVLLLLELATDHWFADIYVTDVYILGAGDLALLVPIVFLSGMTLMSIGGAFGSAWMRFGSRGPLLIAMGGALVLAVGALLGVPLFPAIAASFELWWLAVAAIVVIVVSSLGSYGLLRRASVR